MKGPLHRGRDLGPIQATSADFPDLPARVPAGEYFEGAIAEAQWRYWNASAEERERITALLVPGWADQQEVRGWSETVPLDLLPHFEPTIPQEDHRA